MLPREGRDDAGSLVSIEMTRFHALTERARYTHSAASTEIEFILTVRHAETGAIPVGAASGRPDLPRPWRPGPRSRAEVAGQHPACPHPGP